jgi:DNA-binding NarL/FixJ family response regulator
MIHVVVIDDHPMLRQGLIASIEDDPELEVVGSAGSAEEGVELVREFNPDVVLLDLELPGMSGIESIPHLMAASPTSGVLVFTAYETDERVLGSIRAGAKGYLLKGATAAEICSAIRTVAQGGSALDPRVAAKLVGAVRGPRGAGPPTIREREVLRLIAAGHPNKVIARSLGISERTVKFHATALLRKLGADNRAQAVAIAAQRGLLDGVEAS